MFSLFICTISSINYENVFNRSEISQKDRYYSVISENNLVDIPEEKNDTESLYFYYDNITNMTQSQANDSQNNNFVNVIIIGNGISQNHGEFSDFQSLFPQNFTTYYKETQKNPTYFNSSDPENSEMAKNITAQIEGTSSSSIAFGTNIGITKNVNINYYPFPLHSMYPLQSLTETIRQMNIENTSLILFSADHYSFKISSGGQSNSYVELKYWSNLTESLLVHNPDLIILLSAGNQGVEPYDVQYHSFGYLPYTGIITSVTHLGSAAYYSQWSSSVLCCAPGGGTDTFTNGNFKYNPKIVGAYPSDSNYTGVNGTNAASAIVAGIAAGLKQKYGHDLDFRVFKYMVAITSTRTDPNNAHWTHNRAGFYHHPAFGFGIINSGKLNDINVSSLKSKIGNYVNSSHYPGVDDDNPEYLSYGNEENEPIIIYVDNPKAKFVEEVQLHFSLRKCVFTDLAIVLISPSNTAVTICSGAIGTGYSGYSKTPLQPLEKYVMTSRAFFGEPSQGQWQLRVKHAGYIPLDEIWGISLAIFGSDSEVMDVFSQQEEGNDPFIFANDELEDVNIITLHGLDNNTSYQCNENISFSFNASAFINSFTDNDNDRIICLPTFLSHSHSESQNIPHETNRIFDLDTTVSISKQQAMNGTIINGTFAVPCLVNENVILFFGVRDPIRNIVAESDKFTIKNNFTDFSVINYEPYHTFFEVDNINFLYARQSNHLPEHAFMQKVHIAIFDMKTRDIIYTGHSPDNGVVTIPFNQDIPRGVLSISILDNFTENYCSSVIFPFRYYTKVRDDYPDQPFTVFLNSNDGCPIPPGISVSPRSYLQESEEGINTFNMFFFGLTFPILVFIVTTIYIYFGYYISRPSNPETS